MDLQNICADYQGYTITSDKQLMIVSDIHTWLANESYWCKGIPLDTFLRSFNNSFCIGAIAGDRQVGFARMITDYASFGYLADVFVVEAHRGKGIAKQMMELLLSQQWVQNLRGIKLQTSDMHPLYAQFGFTLCRFPERIMEISRPGIYG
jgi:GNAT superfamily N-acetyltransferase